MIHVVVVHSLKKVGGMYFLNVGVQGLKAWFLTSVWLQLFLHKVFGYRGTILFPWVARVCDRDKEAKDTEK